MVSSLNLFNFSHSWTLCLVTGAVCVASTFFFAIVWFIRRDVHLRDIPGPVERTSWLYGNLPELLLSQPYGNYEFQWRELFGSTYRLKGRFCENLLFTSDPTTIRFILNDSKLFDFPPHRNFIALMLLGKESIFALQNGGEAHRRVKNAFSPAFTQARLQPYVPVIRTLTHKVNEKLTQLYSGKGEGCEDVTVELFHLLQQLTSDIIGKIGFGYDFKAVETGGGDEVARILNNLLLLASKRSNLAILGDNMIHHIPPLILRLILHLPTRTFRVVQKFRTITKPWATTLVIDGLRDGSITDTGLVGFVASTNLESQKRERLSLDEITQQAGTLLLAGQETTSNALAWALFELAKHPSWQDQIRKQIMEAYDSLDSNLDKLEYLNAHIKETLRFHSTVPLSERMAFDDTVLPLSQPVTTTSGRVISELPVRKGQIIYLGLASYHRNTHVWGPDANIFQPTRWLDCRDYSAAGGLPVSIGPYANLASFVGGARMCLGWRLGILEMQVILSELVSKFQFSLNPGQENDMTSCFALTLLPLNVKTGKPSLQLLVRPVQDL